MLYELKNERLTVKVSDQGGTLWSILDRDGTEYLWQGDPRYWEDRGPNLFPYIARLTGRRYRLDGKIYEMDIHGFLKDSVMEMERSEADFLKLSLKSSEVTEQQYPFAFALDIEYALCGSRIEITFRVHNRDEKKMYFGIGGHPGFQVPLEDGYTFEDYRLEFAEAASPKRVDFSEDCFVTGKETDFALQDGRILPLRHDLFDEDAIVLRDMAKTVSLVSAGKKGVRVSYPQMDYLGFWHMPKTDAPYVCIEPWSSLPSRKGVVEDLPTQPGLLSLEPGAVYENRWSIEILS